jgi:hypothetical protein
MFLRQAAGYREINLSPSGNWAAYGFDGYRSGMAPAPLAPPVIEVVPGETFTMTAQLSPDVTRGATHAGLTAVIEEEGGHAIGLWPILTASPISIRPLASSCRLGQRSIHD